MGIYAEEWFALNNDPDFRELSFGEQVEERYRYLTNRLQADSDFMSLSDDEKLGFLEEMAFQPPKFKDAKKDVKVAALSQRFWTEKGILEAGQLAGRPHSTQATPAIVEVNATYMGYMMRNNAIPKLLAKGVDGVMQLFGRKDQVLTEMWYGEDASKEADYYGYLIDKEYEGQTFKLPVIGQMVTEGRLIDRTGEKPRLALGGAEMTGRQVTALTGSLAGLAMDLAGMYAATRGVPSSFFRNVAQNLANRVVVKGTVSGLVNSALKGIGAGVVDVVAEGAVMEVRDELLRMADGQQPNWAVPGGWKRIAENFGQGALLDFAANFVLSGLVPMAAGVGRTLTGFKTLEKSLPKMDPKVLRTVIREWQMGRQVSDAMLDSLTDVSKAAVRQAESVILGTMKKGASAATDPKIRTHLAAFNSGVVTSELPDGKWRMQRLHDPGFDETWDNIVVANKRLSQMTIDKAANVSEETLKRWVQSKWWIEPFGTRGHADTLYDMSEAARVDTKFAAEHAKAFRSKAYVPVSRRPLINSVEADILSGAANKYWRSQLGFKPEYVGRVAPDLSDAERTVMNTNRMALFDVDSKVVHLRPGDNKAEGFIILERIAPKKEYDAATRQAQKLLSSTSTKASVEDMRRYILVGAGYDAASLGGDAVEVLLPANKLRLIDNRISSKTGMLTRAKGIPENAPLGRLGAKATISVKLDAEMPRVPGIAPDQRLLMTALGDLGGPVDQDRVLQFSRAYLDQYGVSPAKARIELDAKLDAVGRPTVLHTKGDQLIVIAPKNIPTEQMRTNFVDALFTQLNDIVKAQGKTLDPTAIPKMQVRDFERYHSKYIVAGLDASQKETWLRHMARQQNTMVNYDAIHKKWTLDAPGMDRPQEFADIDGVLDAVAVHSISAKHLESDLIENGYQLLTKKKGNKFDHYEIAEAGGKSIPGWEGKTIPELLNNANYRPSKLPHTMGPKMAFLSNDINAFTITDDGVLTGHYSKVVKFLDNFEDYQEKMLQRVSKHRNYNWIKHSNATIEVYLPQAGIRRTFDNPIEAKKWAESGWQEIDEVIKTCGRKGFGVSFKDGGFTLTGNGRTYRVTYGADPEDPWADFFRVMKEYPDPSWAPDIDAVLPEALRNIAYAQKLNVGPPAVPHFVRTPPQTTYFSPIRTLWNRLMPRVRAIERIAETTGQLEIAQMFDEVIRGGLLYHSEAARAAKMHAAVFEQAGLLRGRGVKSRRMAITEYLESKDKVKFQRSQYKLSPDELRVAKQVRELYDQYFARFGLDPAKYLEEYIPHIRDWIYRQRPEAVRDLPTAMDLASRAFGGKGKIPKEVEFWAEKMRTQDFVQYIFDRDSLSLVNRYASHGMRRTLVGPSWAKLAGQVNRSKSELAPELVKNLSEYFDMTMGSGYSDTERLFKQWNNRWAKAVAKGEKITPKLMRKFEKANTSWLDRAMTLNYMSYLGWRPWTAIRNSMQIYSTLMPRFGVGNVMQATVDVMEHGNEIVDVMRSAGLISDPPPIATGLAASNTLLGRMADASLGMFKNADDYTRAVAYQVAHRSFNDALGVMKSRMAKHGNKVISSDVEEFLVRAQVNKMPPNVRESVAQMLMAGKTDAARMVYATRVVNDTMFLYQRATRPAMYSGSILGKLFGQFGIYSSGFVSNLLDGLRYGTPAQKVAFMSRWVGGAAAMTGAGAMLGIDMGNDFSMLGPARFTGGPWFYIGLTAIQALGKDYRARQARGELMRMPQMLVPGNYFVKGILDALALADQGHLWEAFLRFNSAPLLKDPSELD